MTTVLVISLVILAIMLPILTIFAFILGFNLSSGKKIALPKRKKKEKDEEESMLERIDKATVY